MVQHQGSLGQHLLHLGALIVQDAQRIQLRATLGLLVQRQRGQEVLQLLPVSGAVVPVAQAGQLQTKAVQPD